MRQAQEFPDRYHRQILLPQIGREGQQRLARSSVLLVGAGALGTVIGDLLARAGVGRLRIVDRDIVEPSNLQRQTLFEEEDARQGVPKAIAAAARLGRVNSQITLEPLALDVNATNVERLAEGMDLLLDGTDNVMTRYLVNDVSVKHEVPWVYGAAIGVEGRMLPIDPGETACLRCLFPTPPAPGDLPTCDTAGVLGMVPSMVASLQATAALKILTGQADAAFGWLYTLDVWNNRVRVTDARGARREDCRCCGLREFEFLNRRASESTATLCGRNAVQVAPARPVRLDLRQLAERLSEVGTVRATPHLVRCALQEGDVTLSIFPDGRAIVQGVNDPGRARSIYARYVGG